MGDSAEERPAIAVPETRTERHTRVMEFMDAGYDFDDIEHVWPELYEAWLEDQGRAGEDK